MKGLEVRYSEYAFAEYIQPGNEKLGAFYSCAMGQHPKKEATTARYHWSLFGQALGRGDFVRARDGGGLNSLLNFGYTILLSLTLRNLFAVGLDPTFGIFHATRERAMPLAYDLMEPFRSCVDARVYGWAEAHSDPADWKVSPEFKRWIVPLTEQKIVYQDRRLSMRNCLERSIRSFRSAVLDNKATGYQPWTLRNSKWAG